jgi:hypothetical protein
MENFGNLETESVEENDLDTLLEENDDLVDEEKDLDEFGDTESDDDDDPDGVLFESFDDEESF